MLITNAIVTFLLGTPAYIAGLPSRCLRRVPQPDLTLYSGVKQVHADNCHFTNGIKGASEDQVIDETTGLVYFSPGNVEKKKKWFPPCNWWNEEGATTDQFSVFDPETQEFSKMDLDYDGEFVSHGLSIMVDPRDPKRRLIFGINHSTTGRRVSVFSFAAGKKTISHIGDIINRRIHTPNAVVAVLEPDGTIGLTVTNDHKFPKGYMRKVEDNYGPFLWGDIGYCNLKIDADGISQLGCDTVERDTSLPNGLVNIPGTTEFVAADTRLGNVRHYNWDFEAKKLTLLSSTPLGVTVDNVRIIPGTRDALVAGYPNMTQVDAGFTHIGDMDYPVEAVAIRVNRSENYTVPHVIHKNNGQFDLQILTVFNYLPKHELLLGSSVINNGVLLCTL
ncbi:hypothetical protein CJU89_4131 [Yarrowia sp. B02]|nr:hypothetical protein CJU89_4131 [Yarrowia sp. B02]